VEGHSEKVSFIWSVADLHKGDRKPTVLRLDCLAKPAKKATGATCQAPGQGRQRHAADAAEPCRRSEFPQRLQVHFRLPTPPKSNHLIKMSRTFSENPAMQDEAIGPSAPSYDPACGAGDGASRTRCSHRAATGGGWLPPNDPSCQRVPH
jgi:hypothetical protein